MLKRTLFCKSVEPAEAVSLAVKNATAAMAAHGPQTFRASDLKYAGTKKDAPLPDILNHPHQLGFGVHFTHHMINVKWSETQHWSKPEMVDFGNISIPPQCGGLQYALQTFEGLKAYLNPQGEPVLFRPNMNAKRMNLSNERLALPEYDPEEWVKLIQAVVYQDRAWIPKDSGFSLYIRPYTIGINENLRVGPADKAMLGIICSPVGPYFGMAGFKAVDLYVEEKMRRAWKDGHGAQKLGGNYGPTIAPGLHAQRKGFSQILWLDAHDNVDEVGAMNLMVWWKNEHGEDELITAPLDGTILPGVTRDSILTLAREWGEFKVSEKRFTIDALCRAITEKRVYEIFGCGTAAVVSPVRRLHYKKEDYVIPVDETQIGPLALRFWKTLTDIQRGKIEHEWSVKCQPWEH